MSPLRALALLSLSRVLGHRIARGGAQGILTRFDEAGAEPWARECEADANGDGVGDACTDVEAPSAMPGTAPLRLNSPVPGILHVTWEDVGAERYDLLMGTLAALHAGTHDHGAGGACGTLGPEAVLGAPDGSVYFLVVARDGSRASSCGRDSQGQQRPASTHGCW